MINFTPRHFINNLLLLISVILYSGCEPKNDEQLVPSYLHIDRLDITTTYQQGTSSSNITDAWVYIDENLIGSFELPATIPILTEGRQTVKVRPGIKLNGISNTRAIYPFYTEIVKEINFVKDSVVNLEESTVAYEANVVFPWLETFEEPGSALDTTSKSTVKLLKTSDPSMIFPETDNTYSAMISLPNDTSIFEAVTTDTYDFPGNGTAVFLEMNYKMNQTCVVGVFYKASGIKVQRPLLVLNATNDEWKKIYVNLTVPKYDTPDATDFQIFIGAQKEKTVDEGLILLDNIKLVHFKTAK